MSLTGLFVVGTGAAIGAWLRWMLGLALNRPILPIPFGTLAANLIGAFVIGCAISAFSRFSSIDPRWRLFVVTGFCGGLTTFSTFSAEIATQLQEGRVTVFVNTILLHVGGSLALTLVGIVTFRWLTN